MNIRILTLIGVMGTIISATALACDDSLMVSANEASEPSQVVANAASVRGDDSELIDCFYEANRGHSACQN
jgi:hypothetical protein